MLITAGDDTVQSTYLHPFWVVHGEDLANRPIREEMARVPEGCTTPGRWVYAGDVRVGDELLSRDGRILRVQAIRHEPYNDKVYNFHVAELESYAVGGNSVLVHNMNNDLEGPGQGEPNAGDDIPEDEADAPAGNTLQSGGRTFNQFDSGRTKRS